MSSTESKIVAVDFDGTLCENAWPNIGKPNERLITKLKFEQEVDHIRLILWTNRTGEKLQEAVDWCKEYGLIFDAVNENLPEIIDSFGGDCRKIFANEFIDDRNVELDPEFSLTPSWAEREVALACKRERAACTDDSEADRNDAEYVINCYNSALRAYQSLCGDGHSECSMQLTFGILETLIRRWPLVPIDDYCEWEDISNENQALHNYHLYQCARLPSLFKVASPDGTIFYYDSDAAVAVDVDNPEALFHFRLVDQVYAERHPITFPYYPKEKAKYICTSFLTDKKNGDFDTFGILYEILPDGTKSKVNRFYAQKNNIFEEIPLKEFVQRSYNKIKE